MLCTWAERAKNIDNVKGSANVMVYIAGTSVALFPHTAELAFPFVLYGLGALFWAFASHIMRERHMMQLNMFFIVINSYAILIRL
jgi:hypothetical protein